MLVRFMIASALTMFVNANLNAESPIEMIQRQVPLAKQIVSGYHSTEIGTSSRTLHIVYWTPSDREPAPQYQERLSRVLLDVQKFYKSEMNRLGFGELTFGLAMNERGLINIHLVRGSGPYQDYDVKSGSQIRQECLPKLRAAGIDAEQETIVIFCNMSNWNPDQRTMNQNSPYYAGGGLRSGTAWQVDSPLLDPRLLTETKLRLKDGQYGNVSVGKYNSIFVGGVCHELGHALGLPHNKARSDEVQAFGTALMGSGNQTYGDDRRGEGKGTFLTLGEGLRLASHPLFTKSEKGINLPANAKLENMQVELASDRRSFEFSATVKSDPPAYAVLGYMDPDGGGDYDATTISEVPNADGKFRLNCSALINGKKGLLRIVVCQANGNRIGDKVFEMPYAVDAQGIVDIAAMESRLAFASLSSAVALNDVKLVAQELRNLKSTKLLKGSEELKTIADKLAQSNSHVPSKDASMTKGKMLSLTDVKWLNASVGWRKPMVNRLPEESPILSVGGNLFATGIYAHAPSEYTYHVGKKWKSLQGKAGLADGHEGSVVFAVIGDGVELWRSGIIPATRIESFEVDLSATQIVTLKVENAGDGGSGDWGVWADPKLLR